MRPCSSYWRNSARSAHGCLPSSHWRSLPLSTVVTRASGVGNTAIAVSAFVKMFAYFICEEFGLVGGIFFPTMLIGSCFGGIVSNVTGVNPMVASGCSMICLPAAFCSMPISLIMIVVSSMGFGAQATIRIFATVMTSSRVLCRPRHPSVTHQPIKID
jgi:H+/Cl- antiporter ClcA